MMCDDPSTDSTQICSHSPRSSVVTFTCSATDSRNRSSSVCPFSSWRSSARPWRSGKCGFVASVRPFESVPAMSPCWDRMAGRSKQQVLEVREGRAESRVDDQPPTCVVAVHPSRDQTGDVVVAEQVADDQQVVAAVPGRATVVGTGDHHHRSRPPRSVLGSRADPAGVGRAEPGTQGCELGAKIHRLVARTKLHP